MEGSFPDGFLDASPGGADRQPPGPPERVHRRGRGRQPPAPLPDRHGPPGRPGRPRARRQRVGGRRPPRRRRVLLPGGPEALPGRAPGDLEHLGFHVKLGSYAAKTERLVALSALALRPARLGGRRTTPSGRRACSRRTWSPRWSRSSPLSRGWWAASTPGRTASRRRSGRRSTTSTCPPARRRLPRGRVGSVVALADRMDTLAGMFGLGMLPTGSRDPFGLRRAAQGAVRICLENGLPLDLLDVAGRAVDGYGELLTRSRGRGPRGPAPLPGRPRAPRPGLAGYAYDEIEAALAAEARWRPAPSPRARVQALHAARDEPGFLAVVLAAKRIANILGKDPDGGGERRARRGAVRAGGRGGAVRRHPKPLRARSRRRRTPPATRARCGRPRSSPTSSTASSTRSW